MVGGRWGCARMNLRRRLKDGEDNGMRYALVSTPTSREDARRTQTGERAAEQHFKAKLPPTFFPRRSSGEISGLARPRGVSALRTPERRPVSGEMRASCEVHRLTALSKFFPGESQRVVDATHPKSITAAG